MRRNRFSRLWWGRIKTQRAWMFMQLKNRRLGRQIMAEIDRVFGK